MWLAMLLSLLSGVMLTVGFPTLSWAPLSWVALAPLFAALKGKDGRQAFTLGFLCGLTHFATTLYWIRFVLNHYGGLSAGLAILLLFLLCGYLAIYPAVFALLAQRWEHSSYLCVFGLPCAWVALEWVRGHAFTGFPWANLGYTQTHFNHLIQLADVTGVYGVSWLVVLGSTTFMALVERRWRSSVVAAVVLSSCVTGALVYGYHRIRVVEELQKQAPPWTVAVIQGNIDQSKKWDPAFQQETLKRYQDLSDAAAAQKPRQDLLVWPETAAPFFYGVDERLSQQLDDIVRKIGEALLFGSPGVTMQNGEAQLQNRAYLLSPEAVPLGFYAKEHLVPFGEYVPLQSILFFVHHLVQAAGDFVPGHNPSPLTLGNQRFGVLICYEGIFPELARRTVLRGASSLVNITNDAWYGKTSAPYQHLEIESWRSIECRTPLIRAANTGISAIIDATGKFYGSIPLDEQGYLVATVHPFHKLTIYVKWGDFFAMICILTTVAGLLYSLQIIRRPTSRNV